MKTSHICPIVNKLWSKYFPKRLYCFGISKMQQTAHHLGRCEPSSPSTQEHNLQGANLQIIHENLDLICGSVSQGKKGFIFQSLAATRPPSPVASVSTWPPRSTAPTSPSAQRNFCLISLPLTSSIPGFGVASRTRSSRRECLERLRRKVCKWIESRSGRTKRPKPVWKGGANHA